MKVFSSKKAILALSMVLCLSASLANAADFMAKEGKIDTKTIGNIKVHDYTAKAGGHAQVIENTKLVVIDVAGTPAGNAEFKAFIDSLGKPIEKVIISHRDNHHWLGIDSLFPNYEIFSADADEINTNGSKLLAEAIEQQGKEAVPFTTSPKTSKIADAKQTIDGVEYIFTSYPFQAWTIELPAQKLALAHHLGYVGMHFPMPPLDERLAVLKKLLANGNDYIIGGHGMASDATDYVKSVETYNTFVKQAVAESKTPEEAKAKIMAQFPDNQLAFFLDLLIPALMNK